MFQKLKNPNDKYNYLKIDIWYREYDTKGYFLMLRKVKYINGVYSYEVYSTEKNACFIRLDYRKRRNTYKLNLYNTKTLEYAQQITELFEEQKFDELDKLVNNNIGEIK